MSSPVSTSTEAEELVDALLLKVQNTDSGLSVSPTQRQEIDAIILQLMEIGKSQAPMQDPRLFDKCTVAYSPSNDPTNPDQNPPAGGLFRSKAGRLIFVTRGLFQHIIAPNTVVNLVCFRLLGVVKGCVALLGTYSPLKDSPLGPNAIQATFGRPRFALGKLVFEFGPRSTVQLATRYVDDRVRIGVGGRGVMFVFAKGAEAESETGDEWDGLFKAETTPAIVLPIGVVGAALLAPWPVRIGMVGFAGLFAYVVRRGGFADAATSALKD